MKLNIENIKIIIDNNVISEYEKFYFQQHPRASKPPISKPIHPLMNSWMIMKRPMMNALKQKWKDFIIYIVDKQGYSNLHINKCEMRFVTYYDTNRRHDVDAACPKFILDGFAESGLIIDDDSKHLTKLILECYVDKNYPRTEIEILIKE